jgi:dTDP-4-dehydrorhamnose reductase
MKQKILITGGAGLLAVNWALLMRERYNIILGLHNRKISLSGIDTRTIVLNSRDKVLEVLKDIYPQIVIHAAGMTGVEECENGPEHAHHVNVELAENVAHVCASLDIPFVHISTDHLFAGNLPFATEASPVSPLNIYARTKAEAEARVLNACPSALVIRTNFFGWGMSYRKSFSDKIISSLREKKPITLFTNIFYTPIVIEVLVDITHQLLDKKVNGIFNVVGDERLSKYQFGKIVTELFHLDHELITAGNTSENPNLIRRPKDMSLSNEKVCHLLGRKLGGAVDHIHRLIDQEKSGFAKLAQSL